MPIRKRPQATETEIRERIKALVQRRNEVDREITRRMQALTMLRRKQTSYEI